MRMLASTHRTDQRSPIETNFREICEVKARWPERAVIASLMAIRGSAGTSYEAHRPMPAPMEWTQLGCPHGMCERGMGSAVASSRR